MARPDPMLERIEAFNRNHGGRVIVRHVASGYSLHSERSGGPAEANRRGRQGDKVRVLAWHREKWGASGPFGVPTMMLDRALDYIYSNPFFWIYA
jgi:hypothetical protein